MQTRLITAGVNYQNTQATLQNQTGHALSELKINPPVMKIQNYRNKWLQHFNRRFSVHF